MDFNFNNVLYSRKGHAYFVNDKIKYYYDLYDSKHRSVVNEAINCNSLEDLINYYIKAHGIFKDPLTCGWNFNAMIDQIYQDSITYDNRKGLYVPNYKVIKYLIDNDKFIGDYWNWYSFDTNWVRRQNRKHSSGWSYRNHPHHGIGDRYFAKLADDRYWKGLNVPLPRKKHGKISAFNSWDEWEDEGRSEVASWKRQGKYRHQWEHRLPKLVKI